MSLSTDLKRRKEVLSLKKQRKELVKVLGVSMRHFKKKMPRMRNRGTDITLAEDRLFSLRGMKDGGIKASILQQVLYLKKLIADKAEFEAEMTAAVEQKIDNVKESEKEAGKTFTF